MVPAVDDGVLPSREIEPEKMSEAQKCAIKVGMVVLLILLFLTVVFLVVSLAGKIQPLASLYTFCALVGTSILIGVFWSCLGKGSIQPPPIEAGKPSSRKSSEEVNEEESASEDDALQDACKVKPGSVNSV